MGRPRFPLVRATLVVLVALLLKLSVVFDLRIAGAMGDLLLAIELAAALTVGPDRGAAYGIVCGVLYYLVLDTSCGMTSLCYTVVGALVVWVGVLFGRTSGCWPVLAAALAGGLHAVLYTSA